MIRIIILAEAQLNLKDLKGENDKILEFSLQHTNSLDLPHTFVQKTVPFKSKLCYFCI